MSFHQTLTNQFQNKQARDLSGQLQRYACVAVILRGSSFENIEIGFIQRAEHPQDRWSGQLAFPGGGRETQDPTDLFTAQRETLEEVGVTLLENELLGRLNDIQAQRAGMLLDFFIRPFVFYTDREFQLTLDPAEVADFFWIPLHFLLDPKRKTTYRRALQESEIDLPAIHLDRDPVLWGLTYMMTQDLLDTLLPK